MHCGICEQAREGTDRRTPYSLKAEMPKNPMIMGMNHELVMILILHAMKSCTGSEISTCDDDGVSEMGLAASMEASYRHQRIL